MDPESQEWPLFFRLLHPELLFCTDTSGGARRGAPPKHKRQLQLSDSGYSQQEGTETGVCPCGSGPHPALPEVFS